MLLDRIAAVVEKDCKLNHGQPIVVGVSGGPDSLCLLDLLRRLDYPLLVAHLNHHLRPEADYEAQFVEKFAQDNGLAFTIGSQDVKILANEYSLTIEEGARKARYQYLFSEARRISAQAVAVGHTADDQVETVLMHFLRGAGLSGLKGMDYCSESAEWDPHIRIVRPLLGVWRQDTELYCQEHGLQPVYDLSNLDTTYFRNRLRHELIPFLEQYNPRIRTALWRTSQTLAGDHEVLKQTIQTVWQECLIDRGEDYVTLDHGHLLNQLPGVQRGVIRRAIGMLIPALRDLDFESVERAISFVQDPPRSKQTDLTAGLYLLLEGEKLFISRWGAVLQGLEWQWPQLARSEQLLLGLPDCISLASNWQLCSLEVDNPMRIFAQIEAQEDPFQTWLDADTLSFPLVVRPRLPGDRFQPLGMAIGSIKLSDFFINEKLPHRARENWPIVSSEGKIVWVPGYRPGHLYRLTENTRKAVHLQIMH